MGFRDFFRQRPNSSPAPVSDVTHVQPGPWLDPGHVDVEVAGESYHPEAFAQIFGSVGRPLGGVLMRYAVLVPEPTNPYDPNAVAVYIDGLHVGYVPAVEAPRLQAIAFAYMRQGRQFVVLARVWACCENDHWSARVTLSFSEATEDEWAYVDHPSWPGSRSPDGSERLTETGRMMRIGNAKVAGVIHGRDFESFRPQIAQAKSDGDLNTALGLLRECIDAAERQAGVYCMRPQLWPTEQAAIVLHKLKDYQAEVAVLERFLEADPSGRGTKGIRERLARARTLAGGPDPAATGQIADVSTEAKEVVFDDSERVEPAVLTSAAELVHEKEFEANIRAVFAEAGVALGSAYETEAVLREMLGVPGEFTTITAYVKGRPVGYVGALYADSVRAVLRDPIHQEKAVAVRCRIYAAEKPTWTARITLGPYEDVVAAVDDPQSAAEGRSVTDAMARLRRERLAEGGVVADEQRVRLVRGRDFGEWVEPIRELRRTGCDAEAFELLMECIDAAECHSRGQGWVPPTWYTEQAAIILRKRGDLAGEVALLERFLDACPPDQPQVDIAERLVKARARLTHRSGDPLIPPTSWQAAHGESYPNGGDA